MLRCPSAEVSRQARAPDVRPRFLEAPFAAGLVLRGAPLPFAFFVLAGSKASASSTLGGDGFFALV